MDLKICNTGIDHAFMLAVTPKMSMTKQVIASPFKGNSAVSLKIKVYSSKELLKIKIRTRTTIIILSVVALAIIGTLAINYYKAKEIAKREDHLFELKLEQSEIDLYLELQSIPDHERLSNIEDLNALLKPTEETFALLKRWETVHEIDPDYPYPETEIKEQDWMGINYFLYGEAENEKGGAKAEMVYDENKNIDRDIYDFIRNRNTSSDNPVVKKAEEQMEKQQ